MQLHANAAVSLIKRRQLVERVLEQGWSIADAARAAEISSKTCGKWVSRYRTDGEWGLLDRSSAPRSGVAVPTGDSDPRSDPRKTLAVQPGSPSSGGA